MKLRTIIGSTLAVTVVALAGCDATMFANVNKNLTQMQAIKKSAGSPVVTAASIAATMGGVQLAGALANQSAGIIAAGGGNYELLQAAGKKKGIEKLQDANGVSEAQYEWEEAGTQDGTVNTVVKSFSCKSQGYLIQASGSFHYTPMKAAAVEPYILFQDGGSSKLKGNFAAEMTGEVKYGPKDQEKTVVKIAELKLGAGHPLPANSKLGSFVMESTATGDDYMKLTASAETVDGKINVSGTAKIGAKAEEKKIDFNELNTNGTVVDADAN